MLPPFLMIKNLILVSLGMIKNKSGKAAQRDFNIAEKQKTTNEYDPGKVKNNQLNHLKQRRNTHIKSIRTL